MKVVFIEESIVNAALSSWSSVKSSFEDDYENTVRIIM
jgi:hypothetical protein